MTNWRDPLTVARWALGGWSALVLLLTLAWLSGTAAAVGDAIVDGGVAEAANGRATDTLPPADPGGGEQDGDVRVRVSTAPLSFEVAPGEAADTVAGRLVDLGVVADATTFTTLVTLTGSAAEIQAGCYSVQRGLPAAEVMYRLRNGLTGEDLLRIPEGLRSEEIGELLADAGLATQAEWRAAVEVAQEEALRRYGAPAIEGYLLPASYSACNTGAGEVATYMLEAFDAQVLAAFAEVGRTPEGAGGELDLHAVLTLASIVEREAVLREEQPRIAGVFLNRLRDGIPLQADPTVQYAVATPESVAASGWWKRDLTIGDLAYDSAYNTYVYGGLPPGPIANPGIDAIRAVLQPEQHDFIYFVARGDGSHVFARTLDEHNANVERFLGR